MTTLVWFRDDLRLADHPALAEAARDPQGVICLFVLDEATPGVRPIGGAARWWLHRSLGSLEAALALHGVPLVLRRGRAATVVDRVAREAAVTRVVWNRRYGGLERRVDAEIEGALRARGIRVDSFAGDVLHEPTRIATRQGTPFRVFSPFWRALLASPPPRTPIAPPGRLLPAQHRLATARTPDWAPAEPAWAAGLAERFRPGEAAADAALERFLSESLERYGAERDVPALEATSGLSPHLRWGELSPRTVWHRAAASARASGPQPGAAAFLRQLGWREFAVYTRFHRPDLAERNLDAAFDAFPWAEPDPDLLGAWQRGETGYPLVDAGMRELWRTGTMHNRVRMVAASFLTKNLLIDWRIGERWFWDTLVDADPASNPFNWQWVAGCGVDAAPYVRIFNPLLQQARFDPGGRYVGRWAPHSTALPPVVDLGPSRRRALVAFERMRRA